MNDAELKGYKDQPVVFGQGGWVRGRRTLAALPPWLRIFVLPWFVWLDIIVPRRRVVLLAAIAAAALLTGLRGWAGIGKDDLSWTTIALLATGHIWFPLVVLCPILCPFLMLGAVVVRFVPSRPRG